MKTRTSIDSLTFAPLLGPVSFRSRQTISSHSTHARTLRQPRSSFSPAPPSGVATAVRRSILEGRLLATLELPTEGLMKLAGAASDWVVPGDRRKAPQDGRAIGGRLCLVRLRKDILKPRHPRAPALPRFPYRARGSTSVDPIVDSIRRHLPILADPHLQSLRSGLGKSAGMVSGFTREN